MRTSWKTVCRLLLRSFMLWIPLLLYLLVLTGYGISLIRNYLEYHVLYPSYYLDSIPDIFRMVVVGYAVMLYVGYELGVKIKESQLEETARALPGGALKYQCAGALLLALVVVILALPALAYGVIMARLEGFRIVPVLWNQAIAWLLYFICTPLVGGWIGLALARLLGARRLLVYPIVVLLVLLTTVFLDQPILTAYMQKTFRVAAGYQDGAYLTGVIPYQIKDWFIFTPYMGPGIGGAFLGMDDMYGIPLESARLFLDLFWVAGIVLVVVVPLVRRRARWWIGGLCGALALASAVVFADRGFIMNYDWRPVGLVDSMDDQMYSAYHPAEKAEKGFSIEGYQLELNLYHRLKAKATMELSPLEAGENEYVFTLHRYLRVSKAYDGTGRKVPFTREENLIHIDREALQGDTLTLEYVGSLSTYYANDQAVFLPAYMPYYPMAGIRPVMVDQTDYVAMPEKTAAFDVLVKAPYPIYSNLAGEGNHFTGESLGVTLSGSPLTYQTEIAGLPVALGLTKRIDKAETTMADLKTGVERANQKMGWEAFADPTQAKLCAFVLPEYTPMGRTSMVGFVDCGDHIIMDGSCLYSSEWLTNAYLRSVFPQKEMTQNYSDSFLRGIFAEHLSGFENRPGLSMSSKPEDVIPRLERIYEIAIGERDEQVDSATIEINMFYALEYLESVDQTYLTRIYEYLRTPYTEGMETEYIFVINLLKEAMEHDA